MDWIKDHLQLVIAVAAAFAYWLNSRKQQSEEVEPDEKPLQDDRGAAAEAAERARQIREEIRRKIAERSGGGEFNAPRPVAGPPPVIRQLEVDPPPRQPMIDAALLEQQRRLEEQLAELARAKMRAQEIRRADPAKQATAAQVASARGLRAELKDHAALRRAIVLNEVLGPPVGLR
ncbi:MAG: hypothetical protein IT582_05305 [Opitutaceae bacterium]|nr:hypothetical protein [Opitutaceae bacterium]